MAAIFPWSPHSYLPVYLRCFPRYLIQSNCSSTNMNTCSKTANPPSTPALSRETFEELMEISQVPHEKENHQSRVSRLETQLSQLLNDNLALLGQCDALPARVKCLVSMANNLASSLCDNCGIKCTPPPPSRMLRQQAVVRF